MVGTRTTIARDDPEFPPSLAHIARAPEKLRVHGSLGDPDGRRVAVVGTRRADDYGRMMAYELAADLARHGVTVVSGGAEGIDAEAHRGALDARGHTLAVMGCGLDVVYPPQHRALFERIVAQGGALISEYEDDKEPTQWTFPARNRIVSGMCDAVVVIRSPLKSGAMITAELALKQGVALFAVPGAAHDPMSAGPLELLRRGARMAVKAADILSPLGLMPSDLSDEATLVDAPRQLALPGLSPDAASLFSALSREPRHAEEVARETGLPLGRTLAGLLALELEGLCIQRPGHYFLRPNPLS
jgi:DNA processing protein